MIIFKYRHEQELSEGNYNSIGNNLKHSKFDFTILKSRVKTQTAKWHIIFGCYTYMGINIKNCIKNIKTSSNQ